MRSRQPRGAVLVLAAILMVLLTALSSAFYYLTRIIGGSRQVTNATDAGAINAARTLLSISVPASSVAPEFQGLGVNVPADPSNPALPPGAPDPVNGKYNLFAYNRAAGAAALISANALQILNDSPTATSARDNAARVVDSLQQFARQLNQALIVSGQQGNSIALAFKNMAAQNNVKMIGSDSSIDTVGDLQLASVPTSTDGTAGKSNVYWNSAVIGSSNFYSNLLSGTQDSSGSIKSTAQPDTNAVTYEQPPIFQSGQSFLKAYAPIHFDFGGGVVRDIYLSACNPASQPHLIDQSRFNSASSSNSKNYAPFNAVMGQTQTMETNKTNKLITAAACAVVGSIYNQYPATLAHGYIRIRNGPDSRTANSSLNGLYATINGSPIIFNNQLFEGTGGGMGIVQSDNGVFGTVASGTGEELAYWAAYNNSTGRDPLGHYDHIDPTHGLQFGSLYTGINVRVPVVYWPYPKENSRYGANPNGLATLAEMRNIHAVYPVCSATMYGDPNISPVCLDNFDKWNSNYNDGSGTAVPLPTSTTITNLEALKGEVITQWWNHWLSSAPGTNNFKYTFSTAGSEFANDSGSKIYQRHNVGYATPSNSPTIAFGTVASPGQLVDQLAGNGSTCMNLSNSSEWGDSNSISGKLLQRAKEILPTADASMIKTLLYQMPIDLGQYQYIYLPPGASTLAISQSPPAILKGLPEFSQPGITAPDGSAMPQCQDTGFNGAVGNQVNAQIGAAGQNIMGDNYLHDQPFLIFNGSVGTYDYVTWTPSTGANNLLGELSFYNHVAANGTFSAPN